MYLFIYLMRVLMTWQIMNATLERTFSTQIAAPNLMTPLSYISLQIRCKWKRFYKEYLICRASDLFFQHVQQFRLFTMKKGNGYLTLQKGMCLSLEKMK